MYTHARTTGMCETHRCARHEGLRMMNMRNYHIWPNRSSVAEPLQHTSEWNYNGTEH